jgi:transcriptional regulator with XRE-family HTH domain
MCFIISFFMSKINLDFILKNIRRIRSHDYLSQEYMAAKLGIGQNAYSKIELGKTRITVERLFEIAYALGVDVPELLKQEPRIK